ncbi:metallophosphoesterase [Maritimibacter fusiformis]|uniref:Serine/threonine protein phosphatase n=1 Tax=Maritimibacter fusiformis TaxID=2603819 RepID=A0A5D0R7V0_9RHOB|nr:metallophosphoesterase [Maritimibacter fusiformis]TYB77582.1 serine/threonine protein phosphatase [Maritimibacter fusiformis]
MRAYAIGDIHGHRSGLERAHRLIAADRDRVGDSAAPVVHIGDLCDRGPDTKGVIDVLLTGLDRGEPWVVLKGNHDRMMQRFLETPPRRDPGLRADLSWLHPNLGGQGTLASYGVDTGADAATVHRAALDLVPETHRAFLAGLPTSHRLGALFFCHAGIRPGVPLEDQVEDDLLWIRGDFLNSTADHGALVVHGHTPVEVVTHYGNRLNIDTGAGYGEPLSAVVLEGRQAWLLTEEGRARIVPI